MNNVNFPNPETRHEIFLASAAGMDVRKPEPITREEIYLNAIASGSGGDFDPDSYYTKPQTDARITEKVAEIVADAPEDFNTLKEMSDWISQHEDSAAAMNSAIQQNTTAIAGKVDKVSGKGLSTNDYTNADKNKLSGIESGANKTVVDSALSSSSTNPVQNKVIKESLDSKVDKVYGKGLSTNDYTTTEKTKLAGLENYDDSDLKSEIAVLTETGVKNLLKNNYAGQTVTNSGATFVSDENGVISVSGTVGTSWGTVYIFGTWSGTETVLDCSDGTYILSVESTTDNVRISLNDRTSGTVSTIASIDGNGSQTFSGKITAVAVGAKTGTFENDTIKIMIRRAEIHDETFQPYAPTNRELYEMILALQNP